MKTKLANTAGIVLVLVAIAAPIAVGLREQSELRRFHTVRNGVLYRSGQLGVKGLERAVRDHGIRTIVCLRDGTTRADQAEEKYCEERGVRFVRISPLSWDGVQGTAPVDAGLKQFLDVVRNPVNHPVMVHCYRGVHRTGGYVAVYRIEMENWSVEQALEEMVRLGYAQLDEHADVQRYFSSYRRTGRYPLTVRAGTP